MPNKTLPPNALSCRKIPDMLVETAPVPLKRERTGNLGAVQAAVGTPSVICAGTAIGSPFAHRHTPFVDVTEYPKAGPHSCLS